MKKRVWAIVLAAAVAAGLGACSPKTEELPAEDSQTEDKTAQADETLEELDLVLDWYPNAAHAFIYEAMEKGYYENEGLKVNIHFPSNVNDAVSLTAAGKVDMGIYYMQDSIIAHVNEKVPIKSVGSVLQSQLNIALSLKDKNIHSPKDLEGKRVGYGATALSESIVKTMMESDGADFSTVTMTDVGFDLMSAMTTGNVDATIGCMVNHEVPQLEKEGFEVNYMFPKEYGVPDYYELVFLAGEKQLQENPEKIAKFLRASKKGFEDMKANPDEAIQALMKNQNAENFPLTESVEKQSLDILLPIMEPDGAVFLEQSPEIWQENIDWLYDQGLLNEKIDSKEMITDVLQ